MYVTCFKNAINYKNHPLVKNHLARKCKRYLYIDIPEIRQQKIAVFINMGKRLIQNTPWLYIGWSGRADC